MASGSRTSRRRWNDTFKKRVVAEVSQPGVRVAQIARRYDLDARRVSNWMKKFRSGVPLRPVEVTSDHRGSPTSTAIEVAPFDRPRLSKSPRAIALRIR